MVYNKNNIVIDKAHTLLRGGDSPNIPGVLGDLCYNIQNVHVVVNSYIFFVGYPVQRDDLNITVSLHACTYIRWRFNLSHINYLDLRIMEYGGI